MDRDQLKRRQKPYKDRYRAFPKSAVYQLRAVGEVGEGVTCHLMVPNGIHRGATAIRAGLHPLAGGIGLDTCPSDMLLQSLVACAGVTFGAVARAMNFAFERCQIKADGEVDFAGTMGASREAPVGFRWIKLRFELDTPEPDDKIKKMIEVVEKHCVVYQTLLNSVEISSEHGEINVGRMKQEA